MDMRVLRSLRYCLVGLLVTVPLAMAAPAQPPDGSHDFDFEIGTWKTHVSKLVHPLSGSNVWAQYDGTSVVSKVWNGRANLVELEVDGPQGHLELVSIR